MHQNSFNFKNIKSSLIFSVTENSNSSIFLIFKANFYGEVMLVVKLYNGPVLTHATKQALDGSRAVLVK